MLNSVQILRALAAWLVVGHHIVQVYYHSTVSGPLSFVLHTYGAIGVDLFFVISGFVIYASTSTKPTSPADFAANRLVRVVPAYWLFTLATAAVLLYAPGSVPLTALEPAFLLKSLLFVPAQNPSGIGLYPLMTIGWTLNYEMCFYAAFLVSLFLPSRIRLAALFIVVASVQLVASQVDQPLSFYGNTIVWEFLFGVALQVAYQRGLLSRLSPISAIVATVLAICVIFDSGQTSHSPYQNGLPCAVILCAAVSQERFFPKHSLLSRLGDWSYSTYLCHILVISLALYVSSRYGISDYFLIPCACLLIAAISMVSFSLLEKPLCRALKNYQSSRLSDPAVM